MESEKPVVREVFPWFDLVRGLAALAVCAGHLRNLFLKDFSETGENSIFQKLFYFITGLGHEAVIIFFVLSGCLVGGAVWNKAGTQEWSWKSYLLARGTRLWIVLIPALLATLIWDRFGLYYFGESIVYTRENFGHILPTGVWSNGTVGDFFGNLLFVQTILVPPLGSNGPLWSLANEFWYYLLFPSLVLAWRSRASYFGFFWLVISLGVLVWVGLAIAAYGVIWLMGVGVSVMIGRCLKFPCVNKKRRGLVGGVLLMVVLAGLQIAWIRVLPEYIKDLVLGMGCSFFLFLVAPLGLSNWAKRLSGFFSRISFSLYLFHLPFMVFLAGWILSDENSRLEWGVGAIALLIVVFVAVLLYVYPLYRIFEAKTDCVRRRIVGSASS